MQSAIFSIFRKESKLNLAYKFYRYPQCDHRVRMKIFNHQKTPAYQHQLRGWNWFCNIQGCKHKNKHPQLLQEISNTYHPAWILYHLLKKLKNIRRYPRFSKTEKYKRHPDKFNTFYAVPRANLGKNPAPKQHKTLLPTIHSNYHMISKYTTIMGKRKL